MQKANMKILIKRLENQSNKKYFINLVIILLGFLFYLVTIPYIVQLRIPCLQFSPGKSFRDTECRLVTALDMFITFALFGFVIIILIQHVTQYPRSIKRTIIIAITLTLITITAYHIYIPQAESQVKRAPIILENLKEVKK